MLKAKGSALLGFFGGVSRAALFEALLRLWVPEFLLTSEGYGNVLFANVCNLLDTFLCKAL